METDKYNDRKNCDSKTIIAVTATTVIMENTTAAATRHWAGAIVTRILHPLILAPREAWLGIKKKLRPRGIKHTCDWVNYRADISSPPGVHMLCKETLENSHKEAVTAP